MGCAPLPAHLLPALSRYLIAAFRPFNELLWRLFPEPISPLSRESWRCNSLALRLSTFPMSSRSFKRDPTDIEARFALAIFISRKHPRPTASIQGPYDIEPLRHRSAEAL